MGDREHRKSDQKICQSGEILNQNDSDVVLCWSKRILIRLFIDVADERFAFRGRIIALIHD